MPPDRESSIRRPDELDLICWERYMPLRAMRFMPRTSKSAPTWDAGHVAREAGCWVIGTATAMQGSDVPSDFPDRDRLFKPEEWINYGDVVVVKPTGAIAAGPLNRQKDILNAEIDKEAARRARRSLDVCGHSRLAFRPIAEWLSSP
jgi:nitrilase